MQTTGAFERVYAIEYRVSNSWFANPDQDIALLRTSQPIEFNAGAKPVCPPPAPFGGRNEYVGEQALTIGWGDIVFGKFPAPPKILDAKFC